MKNPCAKTRPESNPYEIWSNNSGWSWKVLKKYQSPEHEQANPYARWFCLVISPYCPNGELGDVYISDIKKDARKIN